MAFLEVSGLSFGYRGAPALFGDVSFGLGRGEVCCVLGPNGAGKTTLLNCVGGLLAPRTGQVTVDGEQVREMTPGRRAQAVGLVAQTHGSTADLEVTSYLALGNAMRVHLLGVPSERDFERVERVMASLGIERLRGRSVGRLSGGERQQVEIARVLVQDADVVLMDEPTNHLDYGNQVKVLAQIRDLAREHDKTVLLTTHMPDHALLLEGRVAILDGRGGFSFGSAREQITETALRDIYQADVNLAYVERLGRWACVTGSLP